MDFSELESSNRGLTLIATLIPPPPQEKEMQMLGQVYNDKLEIVCLKREQDMKQLRTEFDRLQSDFKYNLQLLSDRDKELSG